MFREIQMPENITGRVFLNSMPGRREPMEDFLSEAKERKISKIISLTSLEEIIREKSPDYLVFLQKGEKTSVLDIESFPVKDFDAPEDEKSFIQFAENVAQSVISGNNILVHCGAGHGRTGMFAICLLGVQRSLWWWVLVPDLKRMFSGMLLIFVRVLFWTVDRLQDPSIYLFKYHPDLSFSKYPVILY